MSSITDHEVRSYLLGTLADAPRERIEETLLIGDEGLERLEMAEEDLIEEFLDGELDAEQLASFESHFLCTTARKEKLAYLQAIRAVAVQRSQPEPLSGNVVNFAAPQKRRTVFGSMTRSGYLKLAATILLIATAGMLIWRYALRPAPDASLAALNRAYAGSRPLDVRIGGFDYAPYVTTRGGDDTNADTRILRERAERILLDAYAEHRTAAARHALGKYYLAEKRFDQAIEQFNAALKETPNLAELHNDMGAALLEKSKLEKRNNQPGDSLQHRAASLESIEQALKLQPNYPAAVFNRALCLQEMYLPRQAIEEWKKYLQLDSNSKWAEEARRRLEELEKAPSKISLNDDQLYQEYLKDPTNDERTFDLFCQSYSTTGNGITERLIDDLLDAKQSNNQAEAAYKLQLLEKLGSLIYQRTTDPYVRDVARYYRQVTPSRQTLLVKARYHLNEGRKLRSTSQSKAAAKYGLAISFFRQANDDCEMWMAHYLLGRSHLWQSNWRESLGLFTATITSANQYLWLRGESLNGVAIYHDGQGQLNSSIEHSLQSLFLAKQLHNTNLTINSLGSLANVYSKIGNWEQVLLYRQQAYELLSQKADGSQILAINMGLALNFYDFGFQAAAIAYQQEALHLEDGAKRPLQLSRAYTYLGAMLGKEQRFHEAISLVKKAINLGANVESEKQAKYIQAYGEVVLANLQRKSGNFAEALLSYEHALDINQQIGNHFDDFEIYRGKALTEIALGSTEQAKRDLAQSLVILGQTRDQISTATDRTIFFDKEYDVYDEAIGSAYNDDPQSAFNIVEKSRARALLEMLHAPKSDRVVVAQPSMNRQLPLNYINVQRQLPRNVYFLEYACLPDRVLMWCLSADGMTYHQSSISLPVLEQKVYAFLQLLGQQSSAKPDQINALSSELNQILIEPMKPFLRQAEVICLAPDKVLNYLPFAALFSAKEQKYLIEDFALLTAHSASVFLLCTERSQHQSRSDDIALTIGNPHFNRFRHPKLGDLQAAAREAAEIARSYSQSKSLINQQATKTAVKAELKKASIIHFAAHGVVDERSSNNSRLILAKSDAIGEEDGALRAYEIAQMRLPRAKLVVLSACQSGIEHFYRGEGMIGLGRAFLTAKVPTVVASLWAVDSEATAKLMVDFHAQLKTNPASQALRQAQIAFLRDTKHPYSSPYYWAAFSIFGSDMQLNHLKRRSK